MSVAVIIPATRPSVKMLMVSLEAGSQPPDEYVVVSNELEGYIGFSSEVQPIGWGDAGLRRNIGADVAKSDILIFIDDDCVAPRNLVESAVKIVEQEGFCWGHHRFIDFEVGDLLDLPPTAGRSREAYVNDWHGWQSSYAGCFAIKRDLFWEIGGFDLAYLGHHGSEDQQLGYRLSARNARRTFVHEPPFAWHPETPRYHAQPASNISGTHRLVQKTINGFPFAVCDECPSRTPLDVSGMTSQDAVVIPYDREQFTLKEERI